MELRRGGRPDRQRVDGSFAHDVSSGSMAGRQSHCMAFLRLLGVSPHVTGQLLAVGGGNSTTEDTGR